MEADWEFEIGPGAPVIEPHWPGFVDLRAEPNRACDLAEAAELPDLANALMRMNHVNSPAWTCKSDVFLPGHIDPDELDARGEEAAHTIACYVDVLARDDRQWNLPSRAEAAARELCLRLRDIPLRRCRVDLVIRQAHLEPEANHLGMTAYFAACGQTESDARSRLTECISLFTAVIAPPPGREIRP